MVGEDAIEDSGDYASTREVVREAVRDWKTKRALESHELAALKADIDKGLNDMVEGQSRPSGNLDLALSCIVQKYDRDERQEI